MKIIVAILCVFAAVSGAFAADSAPSTPHRGHKDPLHFTPTKPRLTLVAAQASPAGEGAVVSAASSPAGGARASAFSTPQPHRHASGRFYPALLLTPTHSTSLSPSVMAAAAASPASASASAASSTPEAFKKAMPASADFKDSEGKGKTTFSSDDVFVPDSQPTESLGASTQGTSTGAGGGAARDVIDLTADYGDLVIPETP